MDSSVSSYYYLEVCSSSLYCLKNEANVKSFLRVKSYYEDVLASAVLRLRCLLAVYKPQLSVSAGV